jgi:uncharacterized iron-regulated membrane protein
MPATGGQGRKTWLAFHRWLGLIVGLCLTIIGATGSILMFKPEIEVAGLSPYTGPANLDLIEKGLSEQFPGSQLTWFYEHRNGGLWQARLITNDGRESELITSPTGDVLRRQERGHALDTILTIHSTLMMGTIGYAVTCAIALLTVFSVVSGLYLWWPVSGRFSKALRFAPKPPSKRFFFELHRGVGLYASVLVFMAALSSHTFLIPELLEHYGGVDVADQALLEVENPDPGAGRPSLSMLARTAAQAVPDGRMDFIDLSRIPDEPIVVSMLVDGPSRPRVRVEIDQRSGAILRLSDDRTRPAWQLLITSWAFDYHKGEFFGLPGRLVQASAGLALSLLAASGLVLWWLRRPRRRSAKQGAAASA